jgi:hypothetical protein
MRENLLPKCIVPNFIFSGGFKANAISLLLHTSGYCVCSGQQLHLPTATRQ